MRELRAVNSKQQPASSNKINTYKDFIIWQKSDKLANLVYKATAAFPKTEIFGLTSQLRRAALSVPTNIVEGYGRNSRNEFRHFLSIAFGSLTEVEYLLSFSRQQEFLSQEDYDMLFVLKEECSRLHWRLYQSQKTRT